MSVDQEGTDARDPATGLTDEETNLGLQNITRMGLAGQAMGTLTGGAFMVKILVSFGAPLYVFGVLSALPALAGAVQVTAAYVIEKYRARKRIALLGFATTRVLVLLLAAIPLFFAGELGIEPIRTGVATICSLLIGRGPGFQIVNTVPRIGGQSVDFSLIALSVGTSVNLGSLLRVHASRSVPTVDSELREVCVEFFNPLRERVRALYNLRK